MTEGTPPPVTSMTELLYTCAGVEEWWGDDVVGRGEEEVRVPGQRHRRSRRGRGVGGVIGETRAGGEQKRSRGRRRWTVVDAGRRGTCVGPSERQGTGQGEHARAEGEFFIYLICHDFRKINGRTKIFEECTSDAVPHGGRILPPHPATFPAAVGHGGRSLFPAPGWGGTAPGPCRQAGRRQVRTAVPHGGRVFLFF
jgi:hypothetical protein